MRFWVTLLVRLRCSGHTAQTLHWNTPIAGAVHPITLPRKAEPHQSKEVQGDYSNGIPSFMLLNQVPLAFPLADLLWSHRGT